MLFNTPHCLYSLRWCLSRLFIQPIGKGFSFGRKEGTGYSGVGVLSPLIGLCLFMRRVECSPDLLRQQPQNMGRSWCAFQTINNSLRSAQFGGGWLIKNGTHHMESNELCVLWTHCYFPLSVLLRTDFQDNLEGYENINDKINYLSHPYFILSSLHVQ